MSSNDLLGQLEALDVENHALRRQVADLHREASTWNAALTALSAKWEKLRAGHPRLEVRFWTGSFWEPLQGLSLDQRLDALEPPPQLSVALSSVSVPLSERLQPPSEAAQPTVQAQPFTREQVRAILFGIDKEECDHTDGWWETSEGAAHGAKALAELEALLFGNGPRTAPTVQAGAALTDEAIDQHLTEMLAKRQFPDTTPGVTSYWLTAAEIRELMARATPPAPQEAQPAPQQGKREPWVTYLSDRSDGVKGHYAIARWNPAGYREVWNLRRHEWNAFSDEVLTLEQAQALLRDVVIPSHPAQPSAQPGQDAEREIAELKKQVHDLNWALGTPGYETLSDPQDQADHEEACRGTERFIQRMAAAAERQAALIADAERWNTVCGAVKVILYSEHRQELKIVFDTPPGVTFQQCVDDLRAARAAQAQGDRNA